MTYYIPENFIEGGKMFGGILKTRNFVEAVILSLIVGMPLWIIPYSSLFVKLTVIISVIVPIFLVAVSGINGGSLLEFLKQYHRWKNTKRIIIYNNKAHPRALRPADIVLAQELPKDKIVDAFDNWKENRKTKNAQISFVEGEDFIFLDDEAENSSFINTEKRLLGIDNDRAKIKTGKKRKRKKDRLLLQEKNIQLDIVDDEDIANLAPNDMPDIIISEEDIADVGEESK